MSDQINSRGGRTAAAAAAPVHNRDGAASTTLPRRELRAYGTPRGAHAGRLRAERLRTAKRALRGYVRGG